MVNNMAKYVTRGWLRDLPSTLDYTVTHPKIINQIKRLGLFKADPSTLSTSVDLRQWCPPVEDQGQLGSCTANAGVGLYEYFERKAFGKHVDASRLFLYKVTRKLMHLNGDTGAELRCTMGAMAMYGIPLEEYYPYTTDPTQFDKEPPVFIYTMATNYKAGKYVKLDPSNVTHADALNNIKTNLAAGLPSIFGFTVFQSYQAADRNGMIPFPAPNEQPTGGHAIMAVGYDDTIKISNSFDGNTKTGALLFRNSWGTGWGQHGYGYLPYEYVLQGLATDFWTMPDASYVNTEQFGFN
jgi:C1A family cysteine protease